MQISKPSYYDSFRCIANRCPDSCCKEWSVTVDPAAAAYYRSLPGGLGDTLRSVLLEEDGDTILAIRDGRCPMWRSDGLCRIQAELGEDALCQVCRQFPRLRHDYGNFVELGLELSCPEAARMILSAPSHPRITQSLPDGTEPEYDSRAMKILLSTREQALSILNDSRYPVNHRLALLLIYGYQAQAQLDGDPEVSFDPEAALAEASFLAEAGDPGEMLAFYRELEILTPGWQQRLRSLSPVPWLEEYHALATYFVERYWLQAISDYDLVARVKFTITSCIVIRLLGGDLLQTAQLYSKEIENDDENMDALLDAAYTHPAFTDKKLLYLLR